MNEFSCKCVNLVIVVTELREITVDVEAVSETLSIAVCRYLCILDRRKLVGSD